MEEIAALGFDGHALGGLSVGEDREAMLATLARLAANRPELATVFVSHHLEELPSTTSHAMLLAHGRVTAIGPATDVLTTANVTATFAHPIDIEHHRGRWHARSAAHRP